MEGNNSYQYGSNPLVSQQSRQTLKSTTLFMTTWDEGNEFFLKSLSLVRHLIV